MYNSGYQGGHVDGGFDGDDNVDHSHSGSDEPRANGSSSSAQVSVQRFPPVDHSDFALPQNLHAFALAPGPYTRTEAGETSAEFRHSNCGCVVKTSPTLFSFVLTDSDNNKVYVTCAHFYECVSNDGGATAHAVTVNGGSNLSGDDNTTSEQPQAKHAVARPQWLARALCVVSHYPFFTAFSQTLSALWQVSGSLVDCHCQALQSATWSTPERVIYRVCHFALERCSGDFYSIAIVKFMHLVCVHVHVCVCVCVCMCVGVCVCVCVLRPQVLTYLTQEVLLPLPGGPAISFKVGGQSMKCWLPSEHQFPLLEATALRKMLFEVCDHVAHVCLCVFVNEVV